MAATDGRVALNGGEAAAVVPLFRRREKRSEIPKTSNLQQPRSQFTVQHHVKAEYLEADALGAGRLSRAAHSVRVKDMRVCNDHGLDDNVGDRRPHLTNVAIGVT